MFCSKCGKEIQDKVNFCSHCGLIINGTNNFYDLPQKIQNYLELIQANIYMNKYDVVQKYAEKILEICPEIPIAWAVLGTCESFKKEESYISKIIVALKHYFHAIELYDKNKGITILKLGEDEHIFENKNLFEFIEQSLDAIEDNVLEEYKSFYTEDLDFCCAENIEKLNDISLEFMESSLIESYIKIFQKKGEERYYKFLKRYLGIIEELWECVKLLGNSKVEDSDFADYILLHSTCQASIEILCGILEENSFLDKEFLIKFYNMGIEILKSKIVAKGWDYECKDCGEKEWFVSVTLTEKAISLNNQNMRELYSKIQKLKAQE